MSTTVTAPRTCSCGFQAERLSLPQEQAQALGEHLLEEQRSQHDRWVEVLRTGGASATAALLEIAATLTSDSTTPLVDFVASHSDVADRATVLRVAMRLDELSGQMWEDAYEAGFADGAALAAAPMPKPESVRRRSKVAPGP